jgi:transcription elongation factor GreA
MTNQGKVIFGAQVVLLLLPAETEMTFQIVGEDEADIKQQKLSYNSPIGRALIGKESGDVVSVNTPGGLVEYEIVDVRYKAAD